MNRPIITPARSVGTNTFRIVLDFTRPSGTVAFIAHCPATEVAGYFQD
jgi:hypothetical protein